MKKIKWIVIGSIASIVVLIIVIVSLVSSIMTSTQNSSANGNCDTNTEVVESGNVSVTPSAKDFIESLKQGAIEAWKEEGVLPSALIAQVSLETGFGSSQVFKNANNTGGIKYYSGVDYGVGTKESNQAAPIGEGGTQGNGRYYTYFPSPSSSILYQSKMFGKPPYTTFNILNNKDAKSVCQALQDSPYAEDPNYGGKLYATIQANNLTEIDQEAFKQSPNGGGHKNSNNDSSNSNLGSDDFINDLCEPSGSEGEITGTTTAPVLNIPQEYVGKLKFPMPTNNNYGGNPYPFGQCTWGAFNRMAQIGRPIEWFSGDAGNGGFWWSSAKAKGYNVVKGVPKEG